jgi:hypothetical protein
MKRIFFFVLSLLSLFLSACNIFGERVHGNGNIKSETRQTGHFNSVDVSNNINLHIRQDSGWSVRVETDENLMEFIQVSESNGLLTVEVRDHFNLDPSKNIDVFVSAPKFTGLAASGASEIMSDARIESTDAMDIDITGASEITLEIKAPRIKAGLSGASKATFRGESKDVSFHGSGASEFRCFELMAENSDVNVSGASNADVFASVNLKAEASGASNIRYKGKPSVSSNTSGAGNVASAN